MVFEKLNNGDINMSRKTIRDIKVKTNLRCNKIYPNATRNH